MAKTLDRVHVGETGERVTDRTDRVEARCVGDAAMHCQPFGMKELSDHSQIEWEIRCREKALTELIEEGCEETARARLKVRNGSYQCEKRSQYWSVG